MRVSWGVMSSDVLEGFDVCGGLYGFGGRSDVGLIVAAVIVVVVVIAASFY